MRSILTTLSIFALLSVHAQKKVLDHEDLERWNSIENSTLSPDGSHVAYSLFKGEKDHYLHLKDASGKEVFTYDRASNGRFSYDSKSLVFRITAWKDSVMDMKRRKVKKGDLPKDTLGIYHLGSGNLEKIPNIKSWNLPQEWSGYLAYQYEEVKEEKDTAATEKKEKNGKKVNGDNGYHLVLRELASGKEDTLRYVTEYAFAKKDNLLAWTTTGPNDSANVAMYVMDLDDMTPVLLHEAKKATYSQLTLSDSGKRLGFVVDTDTTKVQLRPRELYYWEEGMSAAEKMVDANTTGNDLRPSAYQSMRFSDDESKLFFGLALPPVIKDTTLLGEEIVNVEVWTYDEPRLYTVQEMDIKQDTIAAYRAVIDLGKKKKFTQLANAEWPDAEFTPSANGRYALLSNAVPYQLESQWTGERARDYAVLDMNKGNLTPVLEKVPGRVSLSPEGNYVYGYNNADSLWFTYDIKKKKYIPLTKGMVFYDELHDSPSNPRSYGAAGFTKDDKALLLYDRYDIWSFDPSTGEATRLTQGRENKIVYRYVELDDDQDYIDTNEKALLTVFNETDKSGGYAHFDFKTKSLTDLIGGPYRYSTPRKAEKANTLLFTRESFQEFPDLRVADANFSNVTRISDANPQQSEYNWGTIELVNWTSLDGIELTGMLVKPENFDPNKKYPLLVNFYEKSSDGLHRHRAPRAERSSLNYSFYTSRGYVIFNPDVHYRTGYPGESAFNCVIPGVTALIEKGFIDKDNIGVQGHSWGGYQIAYLVTKTDIFKAAESGAPVPNMISAYGGIRWWTGLSRQFQYEHTQSRIGGTPWEYPQRYIENSPIYNLDKVNTPLLIMHNDADGHVPWYQGIEFFTGLRRLGKPSWFLNYNGEPHWPLKLQNRKDFNIRMAQFFDHYLKGAPKPAWMERGVPAKEKGINQGYELLDDK
ncbi:S9 family peptidase [Robertkochia marina]|uniref:S9 family peptidase n=1 Tax=Robertkochia marina TaxID=1227945 RepID=A0A4S3M4Z7_9FLAO|nr:prolyl oligopeptidase family serine peptidase [Robertkochia marina]THD69287.1 S9 family peptidase [Robertkochia marina]TRZ47454.1 S9 family peptidase [Robertkochia marina]